MLLVLAIAGDRCAEGRIVFVGSSRGWVGVEALGVAPQATLLATADLDDREAATGCSWVGFAPGGQMY